MSPHSVSARVGGLIDVRMESGSVALQADGSCLASSGASHVLATAVCNSAAPVEDDEGMVPLQVIKQEELKPSRGTDACLP